MFIQKIATKFLACSEKAALFFYSQRKDYVILKNGVNLSHFSYNEELRDEVRHNLGLLSTDLVFVHVGRFVAVKNHTFLIDVFVHILKEKKNAKLLLIGDGELKSSIHNKVINLGLINSVIFLGERTDVYKILQAADEMIFPSIYEGLPFALVEAQAAGLRIFSSDAVSRESNITDNVYFSPLSKGAEAWAQFIIQNINYKRIKQDDKIIEKGFSIEETTDILYRIYANQSKIF